MDKARVEGLYDPQQGVRWTGREVVSQASVQRCGNQLDVSAIKTLSPTPSAPKSQ